MPIRLLSAALLLLAAASAQASVAYHWQPETAGDFAQAVSGSLIVTDQAFQSGSLDIDYSQDSLDDVDFGGPNGDFIPESPIIEAGMGFGPGTLSDGGGNVLIRPRDDYGISQGKSLVADLLFNADGTLSGSLDLFGFSTNFDSSGDHDAWTVSDVNSDFYTASGHCTGSFDVPCSGGTGFWQRETAANTVPAPPVWALYGFAVLALLGGLAVRRRAGTPAPV